MNTPSPSSPAPAPAPGVDTAGPLAQLGLHQGHAAVCGLQWGDEGKGQIVDLLASRFGMVVRYNGGNNAGHSVHIGSEKFALHLIPSGILYPQAVNVIGNGVVVDPAGLLKEITGLRERGVRVADNLRISDRAHVVLPYHKLEDQLYEAAAIQGQDPGAESGPKGHGVTSGGGGIGTTGRGIGPCYADKAQRTTAIRMGELLRPAEFTAKLRYVVAVKNVLLGALARHVGKEFVPFDAQALAQEYLDYGKQLAAHITDTTALVHGAMAQQRQLLFEGANATLLDIDHGTYPFVTSSSCSSLGLYPGAGVPGGTLTHMIGVVKAYATRVGGGPHPTQIPDGDPLGPRIRDAGHEYGTTTGRPRRVGWLDLMAVRYTARLSGATAIASTGLAVLSGIPTLQVCVGYELDGRKLDHYPADGATLAGVKPVYQQVAGWDQPLDGCRRYDELPAPVRAYVNLMEEFVGVPVRLVCVGRRRDQILVR